MKNKLLKENNENIKPFLKWAGGKVVMNIRKK